MATIDVDIIFGPVSFGHEANPPGFTFGYSLNVSLYHFKVCIALGNKFANVEIANKSAGKLYQEAIAKPVHSIISPR